jgi:hypothetical protein
MHDDVGVEALDVLLGLAELVCSAIVDEPVLGGWSDVVEDLRDLLAVGRVVAVVVTTGKAVGVVERGSVITGNGGQLCPCEPIEAVVIAVSSTTMRTPAPSNPPLWSASAPIRATPPEVTASADPTGAGATVATLGSRSSAETLSAGTSAWRCP